MLQPGSLLSRTLAVVLLGIALLGAYRLIIAPLVIAYRDGQSRIEQAKELLQRYETLAEQRSLLADRLAEQQEQAASAAGYLTGPSDALAAAELQDRVKSVVEGAGGELRSTQILPAEELETDLGFRRTTLRVHFVVTIEGLEDTLYELEAGQPYLIIDDVTVRQERARRQRGQPRDQPRLDVSLELFGYVREAPAATLGQESSISYPPAASNVTSQGAAKGLQSSVDDALRREGARGG